MVSQEGNKLSTIRRATQGRFHINRVYFRLKDRRWLSCKHLIGAGQPD